MNLLDEASIWKALESVVDPEIPVVSVVELGLIRSIRLEGTAVWVCLTPTFAACPALHMIQEEIKTTLHAIGAAPITIELVLSPPWTTEWIQDSAREKLKAFGLAPPPRHSGRIDAALIDCATCPYCASNDTTLKNSFGPTLCRAIFYCNQCQQPFEQFKPL